MSTTCPGCGAVVRPCPLGLLTADHHRPCTVADHEDVLLLADLDAAVIGGRVVMRSLGVSERALLRAAGAGEHQLARAVVEVERVSPSAVRRRVPGLDVEALLTGDPRGSAPSRRRTAQTSGQGCETSAHQEAPADHDHQGRE